MTRAEWLSVALAALASVSGASVDLDAGADLRIRQEMMENVPGLPGGGVLNPSVRGKYKNHMRFRPRVWGEVKGVSSGGANWRLYTRLTDEFRWYVQPSRPRPYAFPDELILDNLFLASEDLLDGLMDFTLGRQDIYNLYGLDHVFIDGTPGDGSRTIYADMIRTGFTFDGDRRLDLFALYNSDDCDIRWGTDACKHRSLTGFGGKDAEHTMDDWGFGAVWNDRVSDAIPYQAFLMQKSTRSFVSGSGNHPGTRRELLGVKTVPRLDEHWSLQFETMGQVGRNDNNQTLCGASAYAGVNWRGRADGLGTPFGRLGYHFMSGDDDAALEDGGHSAWDPMWARGVNDSELFLYGTHYGAAWWSNMHYLKATLGCDFGPCHKLVGSSGPLFAAAQDGLGGGDGLFKGLLSQVRYDFPLYAEESRFKILGHIIAEFFNPGDYFETEKPAWFVRWQVEVKF